MEVHQDEVGVLLRFDERTGIISYLHVKISLVLNTQAFVCTLPYTTHILHLIFHTRPS